VIYLDECSLLNVVYHSHFLLNRSNIHEIKYCIVKSQGDALSPLLFNFALERAIRKVQD
jgi:hypothetical protein